MGGHPGGRTRRRGSCPPPPPPPPRRRTAPPSPLAAPLITGHRQPAAPVLRRMRRRREPVSARRRGPPSADGVPQAVHAATADGGDGSKRATSKGSNNSRQHFYSFYRSCGSRRATSLEPLRSKRAKRGQQQLSTSELRRAEGMGTSEQQARAAAWATGEQSHPGGHERQAADEH